MSDNSRELKCSTTNGIKLETIGKPKVMIKSVKQKGSTGTKNKRRVKSDNTVGAGYCTKLLFFVLLGSFSLTLTLFLMDYKEGQMNLITNWAMETFLEHAKDELKTGISYGEQNSGLFVTSEESMDNIDAITHNGILLKKEHVNLVKKAEEEIQIREENKEEKEAFNKKIGDNSDKNEKSDALYKEVIENPTEESKVISDFQTKTENTKCKKYMLAEEVDSIKIANTFSMEMEIDNNYVEEQHQNIPEKEAVVRDVTGNTKERTATETVGFEIKKSVSEKESDKQILEGAVIREASGDINNAAKENNEPTSEEGIALEESGFNQIIDAENSKIKAKEEQNTVGKRTFEVALGMEESTKRQITENEIIEVPTENRGLGEAFEIDEDRSRKEYPKMEALLKISPGIENSVIKKTTIVNDTSKDVIEEENSTHNKIAKEIKEKMLENVEKVTEADAKNKDLNLKDVSSETIIESERVSKNKGEAKRLDKCLEEASAQTTPVEVKDTTDRKLRDVLDKVISTNVIETEEDKRTMVKKKTIADLTNQYEQEVNECRKVAEEKLLKKAQEAEAEAAIIKALLKKAAEEKKNEKR